MDARAATLCCLLVVGALGQLTEPRLEAGGWQPVLSRAAATPGKPEPKLQILKSSGARSLPPKRDRSLGAEARHDIPAFYVWLPTELLDHIRPQGQNFAQLQSPAEYQRSRPNYLPNQNIDDMPIIAQNPNVGPRSPEDGGYSLQRGKGHSFRPPTELPRPQGYDMSGPGMTDDLSPFVGRPQSSKAGFSGDKPRRPSGGYGGVLPDGPKKTYNLGAKDNSQTFFKPPGQQREHKSYNGFDSGYQMPPGQGTFYSSGKPGGPAGRPVEEEHPEVNQLDPRRRPACSPVTSAAAAVTNLGNRSLRQVADSLGAAAFLDRVGITEGELLALTGQDGAYTLFLPSDESLDLISPQLLDKWRLERDSLQRTLLNHILPSRIALEELHRGGTFATKAGNNAMVNVQRHTRGIVTVNGQRIVAADGSGPQGGIVHVISGVLSPAADRDVMTTIAECGKYEGFLTLAMGTGVANMLKDGQHTLFLPSNDALSKVPADELKVYQKNVTALKEFLLYHIAEGIHYSHDLRDGQYLKSLYNDQPIRVSVNVDGCNRRLYEANNSPLYRADIPASNGVVHVIDWVLLPGDHKWCNGVVLP
ncbi:hypothetical protein HPB47_021947 [Ixodes persulcatus]|uniref:Uncharacterized protein n=1 Tax=Ixodes persulcatus TaxID=34615 RepID=A0AC60QB52_IXOPE|nr:hypothetical protein HPB47_021947 [Ixodes persulcatus]